MSNMVKFVAFLAIMATGIVLSELACASESVTYGFYAYPPFAIDENGRQSGYGSDLMTEVLRRAGYSVAVEVLPVARVVSMVQSTANLFTTGTKTPETFATWDVQWPFCFETVSHVMMVKKSSAFVSFADMPRNARIGVFNSYTLKNYLSEQGFTNIQVAAENQQLADMLSRDHIDAWATFESSALYILNAKNIDAKQLRSLPVKRFQFCAITAKTTDHAMVARVTAAYNSLVADGGRLAIRNRYATFLGPDLPAPKFEPSMNNFWLNGQMASIEESFRQRAPIDP